MDVYRNVFYSKMKIWETEAKALAESDVKVHLEFDPKIYRQKLARNSYLDLPIWGLSPEMERMMYKDLVGFDLSFDSGILNWRYVLSLILQCYGEDDDILGTEKWEKENSEKGDMRRWIGDHENMWFLPKYVLLVNSVVEDLHSILFPRGNKKYGPLSSPSLFLAAANQAGDIEPRCFSSVDDLTYMFYFPIDEDISSIKLGIWKESVSTMCAMQGALERCSHLPKVLSRSLKEKPIAMTEIQVGHGNLIVMDSRLLNVRIKSTFPTLCVLWTASSRRKNNPPIDLVVEMETNVLVLKGLYKKYFCTGICNIFIYETDLKFIFITQKIPAWTFSEAMMAILTMTMQMKKEEKKTKKEMKMMK
jgi:hypothetical protein